MLKKMESQIMKKISFRSHSDKLKGLNNISNKFLSKMTAYQKETP